MFILEEIIFFKKIILYQEIKKKISYIFVSIILSFLNVEDIIILYIYFKFRYRYTGLINV